MENLTFALLGLGVGGVYALIAQGMVLIYRGSGVVNLAQGATTGVGAYTYYELTSTEGWVPLGGLAGSVIAGAAVGLLMHFCVMQPLRNASALMRLIATTSVMTILLGAMSLRYDGFPRVMKPLFSRDPVHFTSSLALSQDRIWLLGVTAILTVVLVAVYRTTRFGVATAALATSERVAAAHGWPPGRLAAANWAVGCALAGLSGGLLGPVLSVTPNSTVLLVVPALAASVLGSFRSFPIAFLGGLIIGVGQSLLVLHVSAAGWSTALPFLIIVIVLAVRGQALPLRSYVMERLPAVGRPTLPIGIVVGAIVVVAAAAALLPATWADSATTTAATGIIGLSVVVITGYGGQLSLAQFVLAGIGALVSSRLVAAYGVPFWPALAGGALAGAVVGLIVALPALRTRGVNLAIATLAMAIALEQIVLSNSKYTGGLAGTTVTPPSIFGYTFDPVLHPQRYAVLCVIALGIAGLLVRNIRRGPGGRRLIAVRSNERASAALGINVMGTKLYGFALGSGIAAVGGVFLAFHDSTVLFSQFTALNGVTLVGLVVIGGVGYTLGGAVSGLVAAGGLITVLIGEFFPFAKYVLLFGGVMSLAVILANPNGALTPGLRKWARRHPASRHAEQLATVDEATSSQVVPRELEVRGLSVRLGGIHALTDVSLTVHPGEIVGLIGPNGAGKTTLIDTVSGFTHGAGQVLLDGAPVAKLFPAARANRGIGRSFQSLELFEDVTVWDNLATASDVGRPARFGLDLLRPRPPALSKAAAMAVEAFGLREHLDSMPSALPTGTRRILAIARAIASEPSVLLLDEPAAGLDENESAELGLLIANLAHGWGMGVLLVEHDMSLVMTTCDRVVVLENGCKIADGDPREVARDPAVVAAYLGLPHSDDAQVSDVLVADVDGGTVPATASSSQSGLPR